MDYQKCIQGNNTISTGMMLKLLYTSYYNINTLSTRGGNTLK